MVETRIGLAAQLDALGAVGHHLWRDGHPQVARPLHVVVLAGRGSARALVVHEVFGRVDLLHQLVEQVGKLLARHGDLDVGKAGAVVEAVQVLVHGEDLEVASGTGVVHAVAEEADAVVHGDDHVLDRAELPVVVAKVLHAGYASFQVK